jgi:hypothetical protein
VANRDLVERPHVGRVDRLGEGNLEKTTLLLEYLKEQYAQARQHETRQTASITFLTAAAGVILGFAFKDDISHAQTIFTGATVFLIGLASLMISEAHYKGNRFHTALAGQTRRALEAAVDGWSVASSDRPTDLRASILEKQGLRGPNIALGQIVNKRLRLVPIGIMVVGALMALSAVRCRC